MNGLICYKEFEEVPLSWTTGWDMFPKSCCGVKQNDTRIRRIIKVVLKRYAGNDEVSSSDLMGMDVTDESDLPRRIVWNTTPSFKKISSLSDANGSGLKMSNEDIRTSFVS